MSILYSHTLSRMRSLLVSHIFFFILVRARLVTVELRMLVKVFLSGAETDRQTETEYCRQRKKKRQCTCIWCNNPCGMLAMLHCWFAIRWQVEGRGRKLRMGRLLCCRCSFCFCVYAIDECHALLPDGFLQFCFKEEEVSESSVSSYANVAGGSTTDRTGVGVTLGGGGEGGWSWGGGGYGGGGRERNKMRERGGRRERGSFLHSIPPSNSLVTG